MHKSIRGKMIILIFYQKRKIPRHFEIGHDMVSVLFGQAIADHKGSVTLGFQF